MYSVTPILVVTTDTTPTQHDDGEPDVVFEVGTDVAKDFDGAVYRGFIVDVDEEEGTKQILYRIQYEDGDHEDLGVNDCRNAVEYYNKLESGEIKEWEIGDE